MTPKEALATIENCKVKDEFHEGINTARTYNITNRKEVMAFDMALTALKRHETGWWLMQEKDGKDTLKCSKCDKEIDMAETDYSFCPYCSSENKLWPYKWTEPVYNNWCKQMETNG